MTSDAKIFPDARSLIDEAKKVLRVQSLYALADALELDRGNVQRYYRKNRLPTAVEVLIVRTLEVHS